MKDTIYLIANRYGVTRMTKRAPSLARDEVGVRLAIQIPDNSFRSPIIAAEIDVPDTHVVQPTVDATVLEPEIES